MQKIIVGNWKMNQKLSDIGAFFTEMSKIKMELRVKAMIAPQSIHIPILKEMAFTLGNIYVGAQNVAATSNGAFTGEISAESLRDLEVDFVIIGHSERRQLFFESNEVIQKKVAQAMTHSLPIILCIGESLSEKEKQKTLDVLFEQLSSALLNSSAVDWSQLTIAYEPIWAIGTGKTASFQEVIEVHEKIKEWCRQHLKVEVPILYGGSVKPENAPQFLSSELIDGLLVGGASLRAQDFKAICMSAPR